MAGRAFNIGVLWNQVYCLGNKTVKLVLWSTFSGLLLQEEKTKTEHASVFKFITSLLLFVFSHLNFYKYALSVFLIYSFDNDEIKSSRGSRNVMLRYFRNRILFKIEKHRIK